MIKQFTGYHGTVEYVDNILDGKKLRYKKVLPRALPGDLGTGTYFFLDNPKLALDFAKKFGSSSDVNVIKCLIEVDEKEILDFNGTEELDMFLGFRERTLESVKKTFPNLKGNRDCIDGIVVNLIVRSILESDKRNIKAVIKDTYTPTIDYSYIKDKSYRRFFVSNFANGTELCLRDVNKVTEGVHLDEL